MATVEQLTDADIEKIANEVLTRIFDAAKRHQDREGAAVARLALNPDETPDFREMFQRAIRLMTHSRELNKQLEQTLDDLISHYGRSEDAAATPG